MLVSCQLRSFNFVSVLKWRSAKIKQLSTCIWLQRSIDCSGVKGMPSVSVAFVLFFWLGTWSFASGGSLNLTILHTNDIHAHFDESNAFAGRCPILDGQEGKCYGGVARLKKKVDEIRQKVNNTLFLDAGDFYQGSLYFNLFSYNITADFTNRLKYDAQSLGNHEFDLGVKGLVPYLELVRFPVMACNLNVSKVPSLQGKVACDRIFKVGGEDVAVVGYVTPETKNISNSGDVIFLDEIDVLQKVVQRLQIQGVNKIIAVGHSGYVKDLEIARNVLGIDVVVGGHTNTFLYTGIPPTKDEVPVAEYPTVVTQTDGSKALVVQDYAYGKYLGYLNVLFDDHGRIASWSGNPILLNSSVKMDQEIVEALLPYKAEVEKMGLTVVGHTRVLLHGDESRCRLKECNLGNLLTDALVNYFASTAEPSSGWIKYSIAIFNSGGIRASIDEELNKGNVTMEDAMRVLPFGDTVDAGALFGRHLRETMEWSVYNYDELALPGAFLQVSGLKVTYDLSRPPGQRVIDLKARCSKCRVPRYYNVEDDQLYYMVIPSFILRGGDGYKVVQDNAKEVFKLGALDLDVFLQELAKPSPVITGEEGRIIFGKGCPGLSPARNALSPVLFFFSLLLLLWKHQN